MKRRFMNQAGFTLMEMIIAVIIMGILAAVIIPRIAMTTDDAKLNTLKSDLSALRSTIEVYYAQHNSTYPGTNDVAGAATADAGVAATAFLKQLTQFTEVDGTISATKTAAAKYGPYIKGAAMAPNPFNDSAVVVCDTTTADITVRVWDGTGTAGWHFYTKTGVIVANDTAAHAGL